MGTTEASLFQDHLAKAGVGNGDHGFVFNAEQRMPVEAPERLEVVAFSQFGSLRRNKKKHVLF